MATTLMVGQKLPLSIAFLDQNGLPIVVTPDSPPVWGGTVAADNLAVAPDGLTATLSAVDTGDDVLTLTVIAGGKTFSASLDVTITPAVVVPVLTTVQIVPGVPV